MVRYTCKLLREGLGKNKMHPKEWIDKRLRSMAIRQELTEEWKNRGVMEETEKQADQSFRKITSLT